MTDSMKDRMIDAEEREGISPEDSYEHVRESMADGADQARTTKTWSVVDRFDLDSVTYNAGAEKDESC